MSTLSLPALSLPRRDVPLLPAPSVSSGAAAAARTAKGPEVTDGLGWLGGPSAQAPAAEVPRTIAELEAYRRERRTRAAAGKPMARVDLGQLPGDPRVPPRVAQIMRAVDDLLPQLMKEKGLTLDRLFQMSLPPAERGHANRWQKTLAGAGAITAGAVAFQIAKMVADPTSAAVAAGSMLAGQKLGGAISYVVHDLIDEYDFMSDAFEFQVHHEDPGELGRWDFTNTVANIGELTVPAMGILAAVAPAIGLAPTAAAFALVGALWLAPEMHKLTHLPRQRPLPEGATAMEKLQHKLEGLQRKTIELLQEGGLMPTKARHLEHHAGRREGRMEGEKALAHTESFDVASGSLALDVNELFNRLQVSQRLKRAIYVTTGKLHELSGGRTPPALEPHSWSEHPELKVLWGGEGTAEERKAAYKQFRIERQGELIERTRAQLSEAQATVAAGGEGAARAKVLVDSLPGRLRKMEAQLEVFRDPSRGKQLETRYAIEKSAYDDAVVAHKDLAADASQAEKDRAAAKLAEAERRLAEARADLLDVAPLMPHFEL